jgi:cysteinyl-tRNA synthetase
VQTEGKRNVTDFVLWRRSPPDSKRLMEWSSPWGVGAPGWHLECSAMSLKYLGERFDLHTGGIDHRQVHHPNEVAQNEGFLGGEPPASVRYWMHNEFLLMGDEKMSKSSGRFLRLQSLLDQGLHPAAYRHFLLMATYRKPLEYSTDAVLAAQSGLLRVLRRVEALKAQAGDPRALELWAEHGAARGGSLRYLVETLVATLGAGARAFVDKLDEALSNDLNTPQALAHLSDLLGEPSLTPAETLRLVALYDLVLGLDLPRLSPGDLNLRPASSTLDDAAVDALVREREAARAARDFKRADELRQQLAEAGVTLKDARGGTTWEWSAAAARQDA